MTTMHEHECVRIKRRGAEYVAAMVAGMTLQQQLEFWRKRTEAMVKRRERQDRRRSLA
jgi:hypothetical protein